MASGQETKGGGRPNPLNFEEAVKSALLDVCDAREVDRVAATPGARELMGCFAYTTASVLVNGLRHVVPNCNKKMSRPKHVFAVLEMFANEADDFEPATSQQLVSVVKECKDHAQACVDKHQIAQGKVPSSQKKKKLKRKGGQAKTKRVKHQEEEEPQSDPEEVQENGEGDEEEGDE